MATRWADNSQGRVSGPSSCVAITPGRFTSAIEQRVAGEDLHKHVGHRRAGREYILESFVSNPVVDHMLGISFGKEEGTKLQTTTELDSQM